MLIVYGEKSKIIRRVIVSDEPIDANEHTHTGEASIHVESISIFKQADIASAVEKATGVKPPDSKHAVVRQDGTIASILQCDPEIDVIPDHEIVKVYAGVLEDCIYDKATDSFIAPDRVILKKGDKDAEGQVATKDVITKGGVVKKPNGN